MKETDLLDFVSLGKLENGSYSDNYSILIKPNRKRNKWYLYIFDEVDGEEEFVSEIKSKDHLKDLYFNLTLKELE